MAFGTQDETDEVMNEINMTPLVDVMLVLLIVFMITVPVMKDAVNVQLPRATSTPDGNASSMTRHQTASPKRHASSAAHAPWISATPSQDMGRLARASSQTAIRVSGKAPAWASSARTDGARNTFREAG